MPFNSDTSSTSRRSLLRGVTAAGAGLAAGATVGGAAAATPQGKGATRARPTAKSSDRFVTRDGTTLYYKDWGSGPAVVFCHGYPLSSDAWEDQMFHLSQNGYRVIAHDRRGFGRSGQPAHGYDYDTFADELAALVEALDVSHATVARQAARAAYSAGSGRPAASANISPANTVMSAIEKASPAT